jgi:hypothetical protein
VAHHLLIKIDVNPARAASESRSSPHDESRHAQLPEELRVGPYDVFCNLVRGSGIWLAEAVDSRGQRVLLQIAHFRAPEGQAEELAWFDYVRRLAIATAEHRAEPYFEIRGHGVLERPDRSHLVFWAFPWDDCEHRLGRAAAYIPTPKDLLEVAIALLERINERHERQRTEPLLSAASIVVRDEGAAIIGLPLHLSPSWLAHDLGGAPIAPEERENQTPTRSGDLWRLGRALDVLGAQLRLPIAVRAFIDALTHDDPAERPATAGSALAEAKMLVTDLQLEGLEPSWPVVAAEEWTNDLAEAPTLLNMRLPSSPVPEEGFVDTLVDFERPAFEALASDLVVDPPATPLVQRIPTELSPAPKIAPTAVAPAHVPRERVRALRRASRWRALLDAALVFVLSGLVTLVLLLQLDSHRKDDGDVPEIVVQVAPAKVARR